MCSEFNGASDLLVFMSSCHGQVEIWTLKDRPSENISTGKKNLCGTLSTAELKKKFKICDREGIYVILTKKESEFHVAP